MPASPATRFVLIAAALLAGGCTVSPEPLQTAQISERANDVLARVDADQEPITGPIDLYQAMARALKYNLDHKVEVMQAAVRMKELDLSHFELLPKAVANSGYLERDNYNASNSVEILPGDRPGAESLRTSTSQEKQNNSADISFSWNILDFGLSYVRARQAADKFLIQEEMRRKVANRVIEDVRTAYWRAVSADRLLEKLRGLEQRVKKVQAASRAMAIDRESSPIAAVSFERELVEIKRTIEEIERDLIVARTQLSSLMNLRPNTQFTLVQPDRSSPNFKLDYPIDDMIWTALTNRSELREVWYNKRINEQELDAALLELLPGLQAYAGTNYDSNDFLLNNNWLNWGAKASWNVLRVFEYPRKREVIAAQDALLDERSLAVTMAVMTQVHVSRVRFLQLTKEMKTANEYLDVQKRLLSLLRVEAAADRVSEQNLIREELNTLVAETRRDIAYSSLQNAFANVYASMGLDPLPAEFVETMGVDALTSSLASLWIERGDDSGRIRRKTAAAK